jgi:hypothetical protein
MEQVQSVPPCSCVSKEGCLAHLSPNERKDFTCFTDLPKEGKGCQPYLVQEIITRLNTESIPFSFNDFHGVNKKINELYSSYFTSTKDKQISLGKPYVIPIFKQVLKVIETTKDFHPIMSNPGWKALVDEVRGVNVGREVKETKEDRKRPRNEPLESDPMNDSQYDPPRPFPSPPPPPPAPALAPASAPAAVNGTINPPSTTVTHETQLEIKKQRKNHAEVCLNKAKMDVNKFETEIKLFSDEIAKLEKTIEDNKDNEIILGPLNTDQQVIEFVKIAIETTLRNMPGHERTSHQVDETAIQDRLNTTLTQFRDRRNVVLPPTPLFDREYTTYNALGEMARPDFLIHSTPFGRLVVELKRESDTTFTKKKNNHMYQVQAQAMNLRNQQFQCETALLVNFPTGQMAGNPSIFILRGPKFDTLEEYNPHYRL